VTITRGRPWAAIAVLICTVAMVLAACSSSARRQATPTASSGQPPAVATSQPTSAGTTTSAPTTTAPTTTAPPSPKRGSGSPVHVSLYEGDGQTFGVAMPIIAYFSTAITDASVFDRVVTVTVNGTPVHGAWYFEHSSQSSEALEAHYRTSEYWPAHASIKVAMPLAGLWAGKGLVFSNDLTLSMKTGAAQIVKVDGKAGVDRMRVYHDGKLIRSFAVSLGKAQTPTYAGTAVVMGKANPQHMVSAPGEPFYSIEVPWSVRVTYDGEFIHDAFWNNQLGQQNLSHGCTNLSPADSEWYYRYSQIGDPVTWTNTGTTQRVPVWDGYGDWNLTWSSYRQGGLLAPTA
jgi:lipoprotein-anchoring transpeptidase ErfK/SrfK